MLVLELEPEINIYLRRVGKTYRFLVTSGCLLSKKYDELSESVAFGQKLRYFTDQNGPRGGEGRGPHENEF